VILNLILPTTLRIILSQKEEWTHLDDKNDELKANLEITLEELVRKEETLFLTFSLS